MAKMNSDQINDLIRRNKEANDELAKQRDLQIALQNIEIARAHQSEIYLNNEKLITELKKSNKSLTEEQKKYLDEIRNSQVGVNAQLGKEVSYRKANLSLIQQLTKQLNIGWKFLMESDKTIRQTILNLGLSGTKAELMRSSFEGSSREVAHLGGSLGDIQLIMSGYADETGKARVLTSQMVTDIAEIGRGTGLSIEQATRLGAQFEFMGVDARRTVDHVQGIVDTTERMGVNTSKVLKNVTDNFKKLTTYTFKNGVKSFGQMAVSAEKTRVSMESALNVAEATRRLEDVIDLGANLQIMGGEFAKMDPFSWIYMVRNEPEKLNEEISKMTKGIFTLRKNSEGIFEKFISPADRDRLANVAKSLGFTNEEMFEIAQKRLDLSLMEKEMAGTGLSPREKELIQGAAFFNSESGKHQVMLAGSMRDISTLTKEQANAFSQEQVLLKDRAVAAQDFDTALKATIEEFKSVLLPILKGVNSVFGWIRPIASDIAKFADGVFGNDFGKNIGKFAIGAVLLNKTFGLFNTSIVKLLQGIGGKKASNITSNIIGGDIGQSSLSGSQALGRGKGAGYAARGAGVKALGTGAGIGAAAVGVGGGVMLGAKGIGELAQSLKDVDVEKIKAMNWSLVILGGTMTAMAIAGKVGALGLAIAGAAAVGIGFGINLAAKGIGEMAEGLGNMIEKSKDAGPAMLDVGLGVGALSLAMMGFNAGALGLGVFALTMASIAKHAPALADVGDAFKEINTTMSGSADDFIAVQNAVDSISKVNSKGGGMIAELVTLLKTPLKVEFANKELNIRNNITLDIDGKKFTAQVIDVPVLVDKIESHRIGKPYNS